MTAQNRHSSCLFSAGFFFSFIFSLFNFNYVFCTLLCPGINLDLSSLSNTTWSVIHKDKSGVQHELAFSFCSPFKSVDKPNDCDGKLVCQQITYPNGSVAVRGFTLNSKSSSSKEVVFIRPEKCSNFQGQSIRINFSCGHHLGSPKLLLFSTCSTILEWSASAACSKPASNSEHKCYLYDDDKRKVDLTPLIKSNGGYYKVLTSDPSQDFYINICSDSSKICPNNSAACFKSGSYTFQSVGDVGLQSLSYERSSEAVSHSQIILSYKTKDSKCSYDFNDSGYVTNIRLRCPKRREKRRIDALDRNPRLVSDVDCIYEIDWVTEFACPVQELEIEANSCEFKEAIHGFDLNLKSLFKKSDDFYKVENVTLNSTKYEIIFNVCGGLQSFVCGDKKWASSAVCLQSSEDAKTARVIGFVDQGKLYYADGKFTLKYSTKDAECLLNGNKILETTVIDFVCIEKGENETGKPEFVLFEDCTYYLIWKTSLVCPKFIDDSCTVVTNDNNTIDLSMLIKRKDSAAWIATVDQSLPWSRHAKSADDTIFLNVCDNVPRNVNTTLCPVDSAACMFISKSNKSISLGKFTNSPKYNKDKQSVELIYESGLDTRTGKILSTKITFICQPGSVETAPTLIDFDEIDGIYEFEWKTSAACPLYTLKGSDCVIYDDILGTTFNLTALKTDNYYLIKHGKYEYHLNVCGRIKSSRCTNQAVVNNPNNNSIGICQVDSNDPSNAWSLGKENANPNYWNGVINLTYTDGSHYHDADKTPRKSHIDFICDPSADKGKPEFIGEENHSYFFRWYTSFACPNAPKSINCVWDNGTHIIDLSVLSLTQGNHFDFTTTVNPALYYINVCRPLNPSHDKRIKVCGRNSAACKVPLNNEAPMNLGEISEPIFTGFDGNINLIYQNGDPCPEDPSRKISTRINFICDPHSGYADLTVINPGHEKVDSEKCVYLIEWRTSAVCLSEKRDSKQDGCVFTDPYTLKSVNLAVLRQPANSPYQVQSTHKTGKAKIFFNVCGSANSISSPNCANGAVCYQPLESSEQNSVKNFGLVDSRSFHFDGKYLVLKYENGSFCEDSEDGTGIKSRRKAYIVFECNSNARKSQPQLFKANPCEIYFQWKTDLVCNLQSLPCSLVTENHFYNLRQLSSVSHAWNATDDNGYVYFINVCSELPKNLQIGSEHAAVCRNNKANGKDMFCIDSLGDSNDYELFSIKNGDLILHYKNGGTHLCNAGLNAETKIRFKCANRNGNPKFVRMTTDDQKCLFEFEWETFFACPVDTRREDLMSEVNGYVTDKRLNASIDMNPLILNSFNVSGDQRQENNDHYIYIVNLNENNHEDVECRNAGICQVKVNSSFRRDVGSRSSIKFYLIGNELQMKLEATDSSKKCGKNGNKHVTSVIKLQCVSSLGLGRPEFLYESNDCDYFFQWHTDAVCPDKFIPTVSTQTTTAATSTFPNTKTDSSHVSAWIAILIMICGLTTIVAIYVFKRRSRTSLMFRFRRFFSPEVDTTTFHYHQLSSNDKLNETEIVAIISSNNSLDSRNLNQPNHFATSSKNVPLSIYEDSDMDLLT